MKPYYNEELSNFVEKIEISFDVNHENPIEITEPLYEMKVIVWENVKVFVKKIGFYPDADERKPAIFNCTVDLFLADDEIKEGKTVSKEYFPNLMFLNPSDAFRKQLVNEKEKNAFHFRVENIEDGLVDGLEEQKGKVQEELNEAMEKTEEKQKASRLSSERVESV